MAASEQKAYEAIRRAITEGTYANGTHLRAAGLADSLGISRTPVREALRRLHAEGLVEFFVNRGAFVARWTHEDAAEVFDLRLVLESHAAARAALRLTDEQITRLIAMTDRMERHASGPERDIGTVTQANKEFHSLIIAAAASRAPRGDDCERRRDRFGLAHLQFLHRRCLRPQHRSPSRTDRCFPDQG